MCPLALSRNIKDSKFYEDFQQKFKIEKILTLATQTKFCTGKNG